MEITIKSAATQKDIWHAHDRLIGDVIPVSNWFVNWLCLTDTRCNSARITYLIKVQLEIVFSGKKQVTRHFKQLSFLEKENSQEKKTILYPKISEQITSNTCELKCLFLQLPRHLLLQYFCNFKKQFHFKQKTET